MKKYSELKALDENQIDVYLDSLKEDELENLFESLLVEIENNEKYSSKIYEGPCYFFAISKGRIWEISNDASSSMRGGWFPDIVTGLSERTKEEINKIVSRYDTDSLLSDMFNKIYDCFDEDFEDEEVIELFEEDGNENFIVLYKKLKKDLEENGSFFESVYDFSKKLKRSDLEEGTLYYEWEGDYINFLDNIIECGEERGYYEDESTKDWIKGLLGLDDLVVTAN